MGQRIAHQVADYLAEPGLVADHQEGDVAPDGEPDVAVRRDDPGVLHGVGSDRQHVNRAPLERALLVDPGEQQQVLDEHAHPGGLVLDPVHDPVELPRG